MNDHLLTIPEVRELLCDIVRRMPDAVNPTNEYGSCVYDDGAGRHCLIGQLAHEQGWPMPTFGGSDRESTADVVALTFQWPVEGSVADYLAEVQEAADVFCSPWDEVAI